MADIRSVGAEATSLSLFWDELEPRPGAYDPENDWPAIANSHYPGFGLSVTLTFSVIDTVSDRRPADLRDRSWDDPETIKRAAAHVDAVLSRMPDIVLTGVAIGNEVDGFLKSGDEIAAFVRFLAATRKVVEDRRPGVPVGTKLTFAALPDPLYRPLLEASSGAFVTYYPLQPDFSARDASTVPGDLAIMLDASSGLPLIIAEAGYPSEGCNGSPAAQQEFFVRLLDGVRDANTVAVVSLTWLHDIPSSQVDAYMSYYGVRTACFAGFLGSLGLKTADGDAKPAFMMMKERAR